MNISLQSQTKGLRTPSPVIPSRLLQRKCDCGQHTIGGSECNGCSRKRRTSLQRSAISGIRENDRDNVVPPIVHEVLNSPGQPLDAPTRAFMQPLFGHDFARVRIHTDNKAAASATAINALAYTVGDSIVFGAAQYARGLGGGRYLLAHELAHVVQQSGSPAADSSLVLGDVNSGHEQEAESVSRSLVSQSEAVAPASPQASVTNAKAGVVQRVHPALVGAAIGAGVGIVSFAAAYNYGRNLATTYPGWLSVLPNCPCTEAACVASPGAWGRDANRALAWFHPGAASSYRSNAAYSSVPGSAHGQQCTYDSGGRLLTEGPGAGTPDSWSAVTNTGRHIWYDVASWQLLGWRIYNRFWTPNNGNGC